MNDHRKPTFFLHMWQGQDCLCWEQFTPQEDRDFANRYPEHQNFALIGQQTAVFVSTEDLSLTREDALKTATSFVLGWSIKTEVDLQELTSTKTAIPPIIHPPN